MCTGVANNKCVIVGTTVPIPTNAKAVYLTVSVWASGNNVDGTAIFAGDFKI